MELPDVKERVELYNKYSEQFKEQIERCSTIHNNLAEDILKELVTAITNDG